MSMLVYFDWKGFCSLFEYLIMISNRCDIPSAAKLQGAGKCRNDACKCWARVHSGTGKSVLGQKEDDGTSIVHVCTVHTCMCSAEPQNIPASEIVRT